MFCKIIFSDVLFKAVHNNEKLKNTTDKDIEETIKNWLRRAKERSVKGYCDL